MVFDRRIPIAALVCSAGSFLAAGAALAQAPAGPDVQLLLRGEQLAGEGKHGEAAASYEDLVKRFPSSTLIPEANLRAGYAHYNAGNYDAAAAAFKKVLEGQGATPEQQELALSLSAQVLAGKAGRLPSTDPSRNQALEDSVKQFDLYLSKYPNSDEAESATYSKALALYQLQRYDEANTTLRGNLQRFPQSATIQDSQYLLALTMGTIGNLAMQKAPPDEKLAEVNFDDAEKLLRDIITKRQNLALANDSYFQIGELLSARGATTTDKEKQSAILNRALDAYRSVQTKDYVIQSQQQRIDYFTKARLDAGQRNDLPLMQKLKRVIDKETEKLVGFKDRPDSTVTARIKSGMIFSQLGRPDETRVVMNFIDQSGLATEPEQKKLLLYYIAKSYAQQGIPAKAVEKYNAFQAAYKADLMAQDLPLLMGAMYLSENPKVRNPDQAMKYLAEARQLYPDSRVAAASVLLQAQALIQLERYEEALTILNETLSKNPPKELALDAEYYRASVYAQTGKAGEAIEAFKKVRDTYPGTPQAEQAAFQVGQMLSGTDPKAAVGELQGFVSKFPESTLRPAAMYALGVAQNGSGQKEAALVTLKELATKYAKSDTAPFGYFERAKILAGDEKFAECVAVMEEFIKNYPDNPALYQAYDFIAQIRSSKGSGLDALPIYEDFVAKHPKDPNTAEALLKLSTLWKSLADAQGPYLAINEEKRTEWRKGVEKSIATSERILTDFPDSPAVALALSHLLEVQRLQLSAKLKTEAEVEKYFETLAGKFGDKPTTKAKIIFTLASLTYGKDKAKAIQLMTDAYKADLKFAPEDLDLYGLALIDAKKYDEAIAVYDKLAKDYPTSAPGKGSRDVQEAQAIVLAGLGRAMQEKGDKEGGGKKFSELEKHYSWSTKMLEVNYGLALDLHDRKQDDAAMERLRKVALAQRAPPELRAKSMLLLGRIHEDNQRYAEAIDNYVKISVYYGAIRDVAAEGLWRGAQLLERQASGELPMPAAAPKGAPKK